jgi:hypothetical protein
MAHRARAGPAAARPCAASARPRRSPAGDHATGPPPASSRPTWLAAAAQAGDLDRARRLAADAEATARTITGSGDQAQALTGLAAAIA